MDGPCYEARIDEKYLNGSTPELAYRVETFRSASKLPGANEQQLRCYFVYQCDFANPNPGPTETRIDVVGEKRFLQKATQNTKDMYQQLLEYVVTRTGPVIEQFDIEGTDEKRLVMAYKQGSALGLFSALSDLYHYYGLTSSRKYVEQFSNGYTIMSIYLKPAKASGRHVPIESSIHQIVKEISLLYCIPQNKFQALFAEGTLSLQETIYAHCVWVFVSHFLNRLGTEYSALAAALDPNNTVHMEMLDSIKRRLRDQTYTSEYIKEIIASYPVLIHSLYLTFANTHYVQSRGEMDDFLPTLSYLRLKVDRILEEGEIEALITKTVTIENHAIVMQSFYLFNKAVL
jgi:glutamate dehydrogenase